jgi:hypothetical protein
MCVAWSMEHGAWSRMEHRAQCLERKRRAWSTEGAWLDVAVAVQHDCIVEHGGFSI